ncbi:sigma-70 family RNA polymerase sigma factor [Embleya sp. NPDC005575]|uniref:sigma-70 family RNA polymerase sigma factor n=1 Tax=Embleya sp. NPDC005575 TaxID=3156892 RepID=UPI0033B8EB43
MGASGKHDSAVVEAARRGDQRAQDELVAAYLPLVYNIVGRALNRHADVDDVVQETMIRALGGLGSLGDPESFRSWLVAITMNQIRGHWQTRSVAPGGSGLQDAHDVADPRADFVDLTIMRLGLEGQRREVAEATRWLDADDRALLAMWWMEAAGELERAEMAAALELSPKHTAVRVQRMKAQLDTARVVVRALSAVPGCVLLDDVIRTWDGIPSALWRKRVARHARDCTVCSGCVAGLVPAERLLAGLALVPVVEVLRGLAGAAAFGGAGVPGEAAAFDAVGGGGRLRDGRARRIRRRRRASAVAAAVALLVAGGTFVEITVLSPGEDKDPVWSASATESESATPSAPAVSLSPVASASPSRSPIRSASPNPTTSPTKSPPAPTTAKPRPTPSTQPMTTADPAGGPAEKVLAITNSERAKAGCGALTLDSRLTRAAQLHSEDMSANGYLSHTSQDGRTFVDRARAQSFANPGAENIARGQNSPEQVMKSWMNSPGHRDNILNCSLTKMGLGVDSKDWTWTQIFGF